MERTHAENPARDAESEDDTSSCHQRSPEEALDRLGVDPGKGLTRDAVRTRLQRHGPNALEGRGGIGPLRILARQLAEPLVLVLLGAAGVSAAAWSLGDPPYEPVPYDALVILAIVVVNAALGFVQEVRAVVVATGMDTEMGHVAALLEDAGGERTPLQRELARMGGQLIWVVLGACTALALLGIARAGTASAEVLLGIFLFAVAVAVAALAEGLPAVVTAALAAGVRRMAARNALVRRLPAVETLGSATVICADETGTLTEGRMSVQRLVLGASTELGVEEMEGSGLRFRGDDWEWSADREPRQRLLGILALNNDAREVDETDEDAEEDEGDGAQRFEGDATDWALAELFRRRGAPGRRWRRSSPGSRRCRSAPSASAGPPSTGTTRAASGSRSRGRPRRSSGERPRPSRRRTSAWPWAGAAPTWPGKRATWCWPTTTTSLALPAAARGAPGHRRPARARPGRGPGRRGPDAASAATAGRADRGWPHVAHHRHGRRGDDGRHPGVLDAHLPGGLFETRPLAAGDWLLAAAVASTVVAVAELQKALRRRLGGSA